MAHSTVMPVDEITEIGKVMGNGPPSTLEILKGLVLDRKRTLRFLSRRKLSRVTAVSEEKEHDDELFPHGEGLGGPALFQSKL